MRRLLSTLSQSLEVEQEWKSPKILFLMNQQYFIRITSRGLVLILSRTHQISSALHIEISHGQQTSSWSLGLRGCSWSLWCHSSWSEEKSQLLANPRTALVRR